MPIIEYYSNYDYIATVLCENKDKPFLNCNGKCYLQSQIAKNNYNDSHNHNSTVPSIDLKDYPVSPIDNYCYELAKESKTVSSIFFKESNTSLGVITSLFKPPRHIS